MFKLVFLSLAVAAVYSAPGYPDLHGGGYSFDDAQLFSAPILKSAPVFTQTYIKEAAPVYSAPILKAAPVYAAPEPVYSSPIYKTFSAPVYEKTAPVYAAPTIIKAAPVVKAYAPATSYASVTSYNVAHAPPTVVKTIVAPQPVYKSIIAPQPQVYKIAEAPSYSHDFSSYGQDLHSYH
ncbi:PREDICTED: extensin-1-like [Nicrophorus vespilloides]|uniref:Extensin-1-like n=1 Tax=Nicrophorus vespilloides TaxID=110193 RepID=A0ABM1NIG7_NICVS|nr:PREDICTED: extensin-1-like [Nicrophorus vespilloides]